jgi:hypothetical protein
MAGRRPTKKPAGTRRGSSDRQSVDADGMLLRLVTIERRLQGIEELLNIHAQQISALYALLEKPVTNRRRVKRRIA